MGQRSFLDHVKTRIARMQERPGQAGLAFTRTDLEGALQCARQLDAQPVGVAHSTPLRGQVFSVKACFDVQGWVTHAGSAALLAAPAAAQDAHVVAQLRAQGAIVLAQTNMTEFAYGALGVNHRFGTPLTPWCTDGDYVAGGSSSGAAVSVALGFADFAICSDTSGSARIPAAFCSVVGYIPTRAAISSEGLLGLSPSFDVPGVIAPSVARCVQVDAIVSKNSKLRSARHDRQYTLLVPDELSHAPLEPGVWSAFESVIKHLKSHGIRIERKSVPSIMDVGRIAHDAGIIAADAYALHEQRLPIYGKDYDPLIKSRIEAGAAVPAYKYINGLRELDRLSQAYEHELASFDALLTPTCPMFPPALAQLADQQTYMRLNKQSFAYTEIANRLNKPSLSLPMGSLAARPAGLLLTGKTKADKDLLAVASHIEALLREVQVKTGAGNDCD